MRASVVGVVNDLMAPNGLLLRAVFACRQDRRILLGARVRGALSQVRVVTGPVGLEIARRIQDRR